MNESKRGWRADRWIVFLVVILIVVSAGLTRFHNLRTSPGWYPDEGTDLSIAINLSQGKQQYLALGQSTLVAARLPLSYLVLVPMLSVLGPDILVLRTLTATCGLIATLLLFVLGRHIWGTPVALVASAFYALYPDAVLYSRFGFLYNQVTILNLIIFYTLWRFLRVGSDIWLVASCLLATLSSVSSISNLPVNVLIVAAVLWARPSRLWWAVLLLASAPVIYGAWTTATAPQAFFLGLRYIAGRVGGGLLVRFLLGAWNYGQLVQEYVWFAVGVFGLTRLAAHQGRLYTNLFFWYMLLVTAAGVPSIVGLGHHYAIPLLPWVAVGAASFLVWALPHLLVALKTLFALLASRLPLTTTEGPWCTLLYRQGQIWVTSILLFWILISPLLVMGLDSTPLPFISTLVAAPQVEQVTVRDIEDAEEAVAYVNRHSEPRDVMLSPPHVAWLVEGQVADFQQSTAYLGGETQNYLQNLGRDRFLFDCSPGNARFALLWSGWREWEGKVMPDVDTTYRMIETWPVVFERGSWRVYRNPSPHPSP